MANRGDFTSGKHCKSRVYLDSQPWLIYVKSTNVEEVAVEVSDEVNGELRSRMQKIISHYKVTHEIFDNGPEVLANFIKNQANEDANVAQLGLAGALIFEYMDGTRGKFFFKNCTLGPINMKMSGRTERIMSTVTYRAQEFGQLP